jgi:threonine dehydratase
VVTDDRLRVGGPGDVAATHERIRPYIRRTPTVAIDPSDLGAGDGALVLKLEQLQHSGSFKVRGAFANLVGRPIPPAGVVAASGGNHGAAVAHAAHRLGIPATIFVPTVSSPAKVARIREAGADLRIVGDLYADSLEAAEAWAAETGALPVHAFDSPATVLGQATVARELSEQAPELDTVLVAVGGGGLIAGTALWYGGGVRVVGVEPERAPTLTAALAAGEPVDAPAGGLAADSLAPRRVGAVVFPIAQALVERVVLVDDAAIEAAQRRLWDAIRVVAEPGAAAPVAALLSGAYRPEPGERVGLVVSGANTTAVRFGDGPPA